MSQSETQMNTQETHAEIIHENTLYAEPIANIGSLLLPTHFKFGSWFSNCDNC